MNEQLTSDLDATAKELLDVLSSFDRQEFNLVPGTDRWSAGQISDHLLQSVSGLSKLLATEGKTADRPADALVGQLKDIFMNFSTSLKSPAFILPRGEYFEKEQMISSLKNELDNIVRVLPEIDLNEISEMQFPRMGALSKLELVHFVIVHTQRHIHQAKKIKAAA
jgi:hypothetical protein